MKSFREKYGPVALIAGASEGLGAAWAKALASRGLDLVLIARRASVLETLAVSLEAEYKIKTWPVCCDLASPHAWDAIRLIIADKTVGCLVYNAAASYIGPFLDQPVATHLHIAAVNINAPLEIIQGLAQPMIERGRGGIILMSSLAGFQGSGFLATYAASKAFTRVLAESLWYEWKSRGVDSIACCAGATATPNYIASRPRKLGFLAPRPQLPEEVVEECLRKIGRTPSFVSGRGNKIASFFMQYILPRKMAIRIMGDATRKLYAVQD